MNRIKNPTLAILPSTNGQAEPALPADSPEPLLLSFEELARLMGCSRRAIERMEQSGALGPTRGARLEC